MLSKSALRTSTAFRYIVVLPKSSASRAKLSTKSVRVVSRKMISTISLV